MARKGRKKYRRLHAAATLVDSLLVVRLLNPQQYGGYRPGRAQSFPEICIGINCHTLAPAAGVPEKKSGPLTFSDARNIAPSKAGVAALPVSRKSFQHNRNWGNAR